MKQRPILFSTPMVQAILDESKTHTRRTKGLDKLNAERANWVYSHSSLEGHVPRPARKYDNAPWYLFNLSKSNAISWTLQCPYGKPGDVLWVREKWRVIGWDFEDKEETVIEYADGTTCKTCLFEDDDKNSDFLLKLIDKMEAKCEPKVDEDEEHFSFTKEQIDKYMPWKPSIHMPKAAARIWLEIVSVKVELVQDISEADAKAEGVLLLQRDSAGEVWKDYLDNVIRHQTAKESFRSLWQSINGKESWEANPWVWVIEFKRIEKPC